MSQCFYQHQEVDESMSSWAPWIFSFFEIALKLEKDLNKNSHQNTRFYFTDWHLKLLLVKKDTLYICGVNQGLKFKWPDIRVRSEYDICLCLTKGRLPVKKCFLSAIAQYTPQSIHDPQSKYSCLYLTWILDNESFFVAFYITLQFKLLNAA